MGTEVSRKPDYGQALDELEALHRVGKISDVRYELHKAKLIQEAAKPRRSPGVTFLIWFGVIIGILILIRVVGGVFTAIIGG